MYSDVLAGRWGALDGEDPNCDVCDPEFAPGVNQRRHDTSTQTVMNVMMIFC